MANYLIVYYGGKMETDPKKADKSMAVWMKWYADLGKAVVDFGAPTMPGKIVGASGVRSIGANPVTGYSIFKADTIDGAIKLVKNCPIIADGGRVAVYQTMPMQMPK